PRRVRGARPRPGGRSAVRPAPTGPDHSEAAAEAPAAAEVAAAEPAAEATAEVAGVEVGTGQVTALVAAEVAVPGAVVRAVGGAGHQSAQHRADEQAGQQTAAEVAAGPGAVGGARLPVGAAAVLGVDLADHRVQPVGETGPVGRAHRHLPGRAARGRPAGVGHRGAVPRVEEARRAALGQLPALAAGGEHRQREPAVLHRLGDRLDVLGPAGRRHQRLRLLVGVQRALVVAAHRVVGAGFRGVEVETVEFLAEGGDVLVDDHPQLLQRRPLFLLVAAPVAAGQGEHARAARRQHRADGDQTADRDLAAALVPAAAGRAAAGAQRVVDDVVQLGLGVAGVLRGRDQVAHALAAHDAAGGARVDRAAEAHAVQTGHAGLGAQVPEEVPGGLVGREDGDEDGFVRVLDLLREGV